LNEIDAEVRLVYDDISSPDRGNNKGTFRECG
jgi:hypothetical protein